MKKQLLAVLLALVVLVGVIAISTADVQAQTETIHLLYDDRKELSDLIGKSASNVSISNETVKSNAVGSAQKDSHVLTYENGRLYAVGVGTATLTVDGTAFQVEVSAAPISLFMITGHSVGAGQEGTASQSVVVEAGQAYSSYYVKSLDTDKVNGYGLGYGSANRAGENSNQYNSTGILDAFAAGNGGTVGVGSGFAARWIENTGEKIWVLNAAVPGSCINQWKAGQAGHHTSGAYAYNYYDKAVEMYQCAQQILKNEIAAGHYTLSHMGIVQFSGANFSNRYPNWTLDSLKQDYTDLWNGFREAFTVDMDGDGDTETVETLALVPFWSDTSKTFTNEKAANYYMSASQEWPDIFVVSDVYRNWVTVDGLASFPAIDYATNSGETLQVPTSVRHTSQGGTSDLSVFCPKDTAHLSQVAYNAVGFDIGNNLYTYFYENVSATEAHFENTSAKDLTSVTLVPGEQISIVPVVKPVYGKNVTLAAEGAVSLDGNCIIGKEAGSGQVKILIGGQVADTLTVTVEENGHEAHCACGGHANGMKDHTCSTLSNWTAWTSNNSLPTTSGNYYLTDHVTLKTAVTIASGVDVKLCLNGFNITTTATGARLINQKGTLSITDCHPKSGWGTLSSAITTKFAAIMYTYEGAVTNLYAGNYDASRATITQGGAIFVQGGILNVYGGIITGANMVTHADVSEVRGGVIHLLKAAKLNMYGGTLQGGAGDVNGGGVSVKGGTTFNMYGGTITGCTGANGGSVYNEGTFTMTGGTITGGTADCGGNIYQVNATGSVTTISGGIISGGKTSATASGNNGGNIYIHGTNDGKLGHVVINGGKISGGMANQGGNIYTKGLLEIHGGTIQNGETKGSSNCGGNLIAAILVSSSTKENLTTVTMSGGAITGGKSTNGGNVQNHGNFTMTGGIISDGSATVGGNVRLFRPGVFTLDGGTIENGTATKNGGNFQVLGNTATTSYAQVATLNIKSGKIIGGSAVNGGNIIIERFSIVNMEGGTISGGTATENGGCIYIYSQYADRNLDVNISGGEIINGTAALGDGIYITADEGAQAPELTISGNAKLNGEGTSLYVNNASDVKVQFAGLTGADTLILADAADKSVAFATADADYSNHVFCADDNYLVTYTDGQLTFALDPNPKVAAVYQGEKLLARYSSLEAALVACGNGYVKLLTDVETDCVLTGTAWIDLNGFDLSGLTVSGTLYGMDSTTAEYDNANVGVLTATVTEGGQIVKHCMTTEEQFGAIHRYLTVAKDGSYTFHRFYLSITNLTINPATYGIGYKAEFYGDDTVKAQLAQANAFGYQMWIEGNKKLTRAYDSDQFGEKTKVTLRINHFLDPAKDEAFNQERANIPVNASVFITLASGEVIETDAASYSFKDITELAANQYENYNAQQQAALDQLGQQFNGMLFTWAAPHIHHLDSSWTAWTSTNSLPTTTGKYYLTGDVTLKGTTTIPVGADVQLCLNGHDITTTSNSSRLIGQKGTFSLLDCCAQSDGGTLSSAITTKYGGIMYTYEGSVTNIYAGNLDASQANITLGGTVLVYGGTLNVYGGNFIGANMVADSSVTEDRARGGVIHLLKAGVLNLYGGTLQSGTGNVDGGGVSVKPGTTFHMHGGTITGCTAVNGGGVFNEGNFTMTGGTIEACTATADGGSVFNSKDCTISGGVIKTGAAVNGGNIHNEGVFAMTDGTVSGGKADAGGNIHMTSLASAQLMLNGGTITAGQSRTHGGNLYLVNDGIYTLSNVTISDGYAAGDGGNMYLFTDMNIAHFTEEEFDILLHNCTVTGGQADDEGDSIYVMEADLTISGSTVIHNANGESLYLGAGEKVVLKDLTADAKVYVSMAIPGTLSDDTKYLSNIHADDTSMELQLVGGAIKLIDEATAANVPTLSGFSIGWYRGDITPTEPVPLDGMGNDAGRMDNWEIKTPLQAGVTVIADETGIENAIILVSVDTLFIQKELSDNLAQAISDATGVPKNRIFFSASHSHCAVAHDEPYEQTRNYLEDLYTNVTSYAVQAVEDLAPATIQTASIDVIATDGLSLTASRRNIGDDGNAYSKVDGNVPSGAERESATDPQMQLIRFIREDKTDLVLSNYQTHGTGWGSATDGFVSADTWYYFRNTLEASMEDTACTFFLGASGNLSQSNNSLIAKFQSVDGNTYKAYNYLGIDKCLEGMGALLTSYALYAFDNYAEDVQPGALRVINTTFETEDRYKADKQTYKQIDMDLNAIAIGDSIAFITAPYEMYHENGQQIKAYAQTLGFDTCFILTNSMGENKYIASNNAFENDSTDGKLTSFGVRTCRFKQGTAEALIDQFADMLAQIKGVSPANTIYNTYTVYVRDQNGNAVQNVMVELVGGGNTRNCSNADGTVTYYVYEGIEYAINVVKLPSGYTYDGTVVSFDENNTVTITVTVE